ncbi:MAG TPA: ferrous iron transport protein A [Candidatus Egerieicola pullicola]|uniref:Ferrous iron transport protein A n=1 Tax=Candidatus Egerieicola pullicola TaxID=2840775 RepID=A0A9D1ALF8_9FIRM|nr:ferrous iron transport protein A [Candidatus Egerieicola pullicola]
MWAEQSVTGRANPAPIGGVIPLAMADAGVEMQVMSVKGKEDTKRFLETLGFTKGSEVSVVNRMGGNVIVRVKESRVAISQSMAAKILCCGKE